MTKRLLFVKACDYRLSFVFISAETPLTQQNARLFMDRPVQQTIWRAKQAQDALQQTLLEDCRRRIEDAAARGQEDAVCNEALTPATMIALQKLGFSLAAPRPMQNWWRVRWDPGDGDDK